MRTRDDTRVGKYRAKDAAIPPPSEYPMTANEVLPVHAMGDEARTQRICDM
jgi:hypothetical protein